MWSVLCAVAPTTWITNGIRRSVMTENVLAEAAKAASVAAKTASVVAKAAAAAAKAATKVAKEADAAADAAWARANLAYAKLADDVLKRNQEKEWKEEIRRGW